jgi:hypothetical protein
MADMPWEHAAEARAALQAIVTDPDHGVAALSSPRTMSNLLKDLLPDAPREKNLLIAAAEAGLADTLREHVSQGMDTPTAIRLAASSFSASTPLTSDACDWVTGEIALAMGISDRNDPAQQASKPAGPYPVGDLRTNVDLGKTAFASGQPGPPGSGGYGQGLAGYATGPGPAGYGQGPGGYAPQPGYQPFPQTPQGPKTNSMAVTSLVLGVIQFPLWFAILVPGLIASVLAIVFGFVARQQIARSGEGGRGIALAGILLACAGIFIVAILIAVGVAKGSG